MFVVLGPALIPKVDLIGIEMVADMYPALLATWAAAAAVRQWGKNKGTET